MNIDMDQLPQFLSSFEKVVNEHEHPSNHKSMLLRSHGEGKLASDAKTVDNDVKTAILHAYLTLFINGPTTNTFTMKALDDNRQALTTNVMNLYEVVNPSPFYPLQMKALAWAMSKLPYDINLENDPSYIKQVGALLNNRQPVTEEGTFGTLQQFLSREGSFWLMPQSDGRYSIDLTRYKNYAVRQHFRSYGCKAIVDAQFNVVSIDNVACNDAGFGVALSVFKSTLILDIVLHVHAMVSHLLVSQRLYMSATTTYYSTIQSDSLLSDLYYLCTYRTNEINSNIPVLASGQGSLIQMGFGFTGDSFKEMLSDLLTDQKLQTSAGIKHVLLDCRSEQWKKMASPVYAVVDKFVERVVGNKLPEDFKLQTKVGLFVSTFYHEMVGDFQLKTIYNCDLNPRTYDGAQFERRTNEFGYIIAAATMGVSVRILKLHELVAGTYLSGESLAAWTEMYHGMKDALKDYKFIDVDNFEFSVGY